MTDDKVPELAREVVRTYREWQSAMREISELQKNPPEDQDLNDLFGTLAVESQTKQGDFYAAIRELSKAFPETK